MVYLYVCICCVSLCVCTCAWVVLWISEDILESVLFFQHGSRVRTKVMSMHGKRFCPFRVAMKAMEMFINALLDYLSKWVLLGIVTRDC